MRVLLVAHGFPPKGSGGAELYADAHARALARTFGDAVAVLTREETPAAPEYRVRDEHRDGLHIRWINNTFRTATRFEDTYDNPTIRRLAARFIDEVRPDVAHVHHLTCLSTTILDELAARDIPVVMTLHDYWLMCHRGQLFDLDLRPCTGPGRDGCMRCTDVAGGAPRSFFAAAGVLREAQRRLPAAIAHPIRRAAAHTVRGWQSGDAARSASRVRFEHMRERWKCVSLALAPSRNTRERFVAAGFPEQTIRVSESGVDPAPFQVERIGGPRLRLGYLGAVMVSKAPHVLLEALRFLPPDRVTVDIFGQPSAYHGDESYASRMRPLLVHPAVTVHGPVPHEDVPLVLANLDALVFPSVWEETSGLVAREALLSGAPVIASRIGAIPETVCDGVNGLLFEPGRADDLAGAIRRLLDEPGLLQRLRSGIRPFRTLDDDVRATRLVYEQLIVEKRRVPPPRPAARERLEIAAVVLNYRTPAETRLAVEMLRMSDRRPDHLIVVDNDAGEECRQALEPLLNEVTLLQAGTNLGFSGGMNIGIRAALDRGADAVLLVNSDVVVPPDCLGRLEGALCADRGVGIAGPVVCATEAPDVIASLGVRYNRGTGRMQVRGVGRRRHDTATVPNEDVDAVSGCLMLVRREVFDRVGLLDEAYFFSFEELELCLRAREAGWRTALVGAAVAYHEGGRSIGRISPRRLYFATRNHLRLAGRIAPVGTLRSRLRDVMILSLNIAHAVRTRGGSLPVRLAAVLRGASDHWRGRYGPD